MTKLTKEAEEIFLNTLTEGKTVSEAAAAAGVSRQGFYVKRDRSKTFTEKWNKAIELGRQAKVDALEKEADRRAIDGSVYGTFQYKGNLLPKKRYSDALLIKRLQALDPERYGDKTKVDGNLNLTVPGAVVVPGQLTPESWEQVASQFDNMGPPPMPEADEEAEGGEP